MLHLWNGHILFFILQMNFGFRPHPKHIVNQSSNDLSKTCLGLYEAYIRPQSSDLLKDHYADMPTTISYSVELSIFHTCKKNWWKQGTSFTRVWQNINEALVLRRTTCRKPFWLTYPFCFHNFPIPFIQMLLTFFIPLRLSFQCWSRGIIWIQNWKDLQGDYNYESKLNKWT